MQRLSALDSEYLYMESSASLMHAASLVIIDPSSADGPFEFAKLHEVYEQRLDLSPAFRRRVVDVPMDLHHPIWIEDPDFDLEWHLRHVAVPRPGGMEELYELIGELVSIPLDRTRALWETWIIEGMNDGRIAILSKVHHAATDDLSDQELMTTILDVTPEIEPVDPPAEPWKPERVPNDLEMLGHAMGALLRSPSQLISTARRTVETTFHLNSGNDDDYMVDTPSPVIAPASSLNGAITGRRSFVTTCVPFAQVKAVKDALDVTVNDVVLAMCGGALRAYLDASGEKPERSLVAMVPVAVRFDEGSEPDSFLSSMLTPLATDLDDPLERIAAIHETLIATRSRCDTISAEALQSWPDFAAPTMARRAARFYSRMRWSDHEQPLFNLTISNVPGPPFPLYVTGAEVHAAYPVGSIFDGCGLNITVMSYLDRLDFSILTCPDLISDNTLIADALSASLDQLTDALGLAPTSAPTSAKTKSKADSKTKPKGEKSKKKPRKDKTSKG